MTRSSQIHRSKEDVSGRKTPELHDDDITAEGDWITIDGVLTTNDAIKAYDGIVKLSDEMIYEIAERVNTGVIPFMGNHDPAQRIRTQNVRAWVDGVTPGRLLVRFSADVNREDWSNAGDVRGMSFSAFAPLDGEHLVDKSNLLLSFGADAAWFTDETITLATRSVHLPERDFGQPLVTGARIYQFSIAVDPRIIIETSIFLWQMLGPNLVTSAIWDGLKILLARRKRRPDTPAPKATSIEIHLTTPQGGQVSALIRTDDEEVAKQAVAKLPDITEVLTSAPDGSNSVTNEWTVTRTENGNSEWKWNRLH